MKWKEWLLLGSAAMGSWYFQPKEKNPPINSDLPPAIQQYRDLQERYRTNQNPIQCGYMPLSSPITIDEKIMRTLDEYRLGKGHDIVIPVRIGDQIKKIKICYEFNWSRYPKHKDDIERLFQQELPADNWPP